MVSLLRRLPAGAPAKALLALVSLLSGCASEPRCEWVRPVQKDGYVAMERCP